MNLLIVIPIVLPLTTAAVSFLAWRQLMVQRCLALMGTAGSLGVGLVLLGSVRQSGIQATQVGGWPAPFGITLVADTFSAIMVVLAGLIGLAVVVYSLSSMDSERERFGYYPLLHILLAGVCGAFLTGDIFNLYVCFEMMLVASFVLLALGCERAQVEGAIKYVTLNLISSALFLAAVGILYGLAGTLNMADLALKLRNLEHPGIATTLAMLFLVTFGIKAAIFPLFFWLPASYHTPPVAVSAIFAGLLTKVGVYSLIRVFTLLFVQDVVYTHSLILIIAGLTMVTGVLGAAAQNEFRRILSFHIVSQIGYMIMGLGLFTPAALAGSVFCIVHNIIVKTNLFLVSGVAQRIRGTYDLKNLGGLYRSYPGLSILFLVPALSLAGVPPASGFFAKLALIKAGLEVGQYAIVAVAVGVSMLTLFSMVKIWAEAFWKPLPQADPPASDEEINLRMRSRRGNLLLLLPIAALAAITILIGLQAQLLYEIVMGAAEELMHPQIYIRSVLGGV